MPAAREVEGGSATWAERLQEFLPGYIHAVPALEAVAHDSAVVLHGSLTMGVDDTYADIDCWLLLPRALCHRLMHESGTGFFEFRLNDKPGHMNATPIEDFEDRIRTCHMDTIYQLRRAVVLSDPTGAATALAELARRRMRPEVVEALFFWEYVEMRSEHRSCDTPLERGHAVSVLLALSKTLAQAMRAAIVLDGEPYPYDKWLYHAACNTPTGARIVPHVDRVLAMLAEDALRLRVAERQHPLNVEVRAMRSVLINAARAKGIDRPWLDTWYLNMDAAREARRALRW